MNSKLATISIYSPNNYGKRTQPIDTITIHCMAAQWSAKTCATYFSHKETEAASNYCVGKDGEIAVSVPEDMGAFCSSNKANDMRSVTIEVASDSKHPYKVTEKALASTINLCADICQRNGIKAFKWSDSKADRMGHLNGCNMTVHRDFVDGAKPPSPPLLKADIAPSRHKIPTTSFHVPFFFIFSPPNYIFFNCPINRIDKITHLHYYLNQIITPLKLS